jgi:hypothetical protein
MDKLTRFREIRDKTIDKARAKYQELVQRLGGPAEYDDQAFASLAAAATAAGVPLDQVERDLIASAPPTVTRNLGLIPHPIPGAVGEFFWLSLHVWQPGAVNVEGRSFCRYRGQGKGEFEQLLEILRLRNSVGDATHDEKLQLLLKQGIKRQADPRIFERHSADSLARVALWRILYATAVADDFTRRGNPASRASLIRAHIGPAPDAPRRVNARNESGDPVAMLAALNAPQQADD